MNQSNTATDAAGDITPIYMVLDGELIINAPVNEVWRHVLNYTSWQDFPIKQTISGTPGEEGEIVLLKKDEPGLDFPPYCAITVKIDPYKRIIWKTYARNPTPELNFFGIVEFFVESTQVGTRFSHHFVYEFQQPYRDQHEREEISKQYYESFGAVLDSIFPKLKALAEKGNDRHA